MIKKTDNLPSLDRAYLVDFIKALTMLHKAADDTMVTVKSMSLEYVYSTDYWNQRMGGSLLGDAGKALCKERYDHAPEITEQIAYEDEYVIRNKKSITTFKVVRLPDELEPFYCKKSPIINPETGNVVGILNSGFFVKNATYREIMLKQVESRDVSSPLKLTRREKQIIFLFLSHLSSQEIASILGQFDNKKISKNTIDSVFRESLYEKFNVYSRLELYKKLVNMGFINRIPQELLRVKSMILSEVEVY